jgi:hypothetical protein
VAGVLATTPFLNILFFLPLYFWKSSKGSRSYLSVTLAFLVCLALVDALFVSVLIATMRYLVDFVTLLLLAAILLWIHLDERLKGQRAKRLCLRFLCTGAIAYGCLVGVAISMTGYYDLFKIRNPDTYQSIEKAFVPLQRVLAGVLPAQYGPVNLKIRFSHATPGKSEPLVVTGRAGASDTAFVEYLWDGVVVFGFHHWEWGGLKSTPVRILPDAMYDLEIRMGSLYPSSPSLFSAMFPDRNYDEAKTELVITLNGAEVLRGRLRFHDSNPSEVTIGENLIGGGIYEKHFSGDIIAVSRTPVGTSQATTDCCHDPIDPSRAALARVRFGHGS